MSVVVVLQKENNPFEWRDGETWSWRIVEDTYEGLTLAVSPVKFLNSETAEGNCNRFLTTLMESDTPRVVVRRG